MEILSGVHIVDNVVMPGPGGANSVNIVLLAGDDGRLTMVDARPPPADVKRIITSNYQALRLVAPSLAERLSII
jgi:hypothetical protein